MATVKRVPGPGAAKLDMLLKGLKQNMQVKVGWFESAVYPSGVPVATVAAVQEFGAPGKGIPPRSFMRTTMVEKRQEWQRIAALGAKQIANGASQSAMLDLLGQKAAGDVARKITEITSPALKPATIKARLRKKADKKTMGNLSKPLIDTGLMFSTLTSSKPEETK